VRASLAILYGVCILWTPHLRAQTSRAPGTPAATPATPAASTAAPAAAPAAAPTGRTYTVTETTAQLLALLQAQLFTDSGRFYPCRGNPSCSSWGENLALSAPVVQVNGQRLAFAVHVDGSYAVAPGLAPSVAGDLIVSAVPIVLNGLVHLSQSAVRAGQGDVTFQAFVQAAHGQIEQLLNEKSTLDLADYLALAAHDPTMPPPRLPGITCVDRSQIHLQSVATDPGASAVTATVLVSPPATGRKSC
jgi:hypothetical protein